MEKSKDKAALAVTTKAEGGWQSSFSTTFRLTHPPSYTPLQSYSYSREIMETNITTEQYNGSIVRE